MRGAFLKQIIEFSFFGCFWLGIIFCKIVQTDEAARSCIVISAWLTRLLANIA